MDKAFEREEEESTLVPGHSSPVQIRPISKKRKREQTKNEISSDGERERGEDSKRRST